MHLLRLGTGTVGLAGVSSKIDFKVGVTVQIDQEIGCGVTELKRVSAVSVTGSMSFIFDGASITLCGNSGTVGFLSGTSY